MADNVTGLQVFWLTIAIMAIGWGVVATLMACRDELRFIRRQMEKEREG